MSPPSPLLSHLQVVLVEPEIPPNTGAIARVCAATDTVLHLVEPLGFKLDDRALKRAGMDYWRHVTWKTWPDWAALRAAHPAARFHFLTTKTSRSYTEARFDPGDFLVFGRETKGLPESLLRENAEACLTIPMSNPHVRSLNLAASVAIVLFEALRQIGR
ncbi:MAG: tRNA (cytidine(34)-2'-O)-methyltransferase [Methylacidiphilales bacterium]|nr:tRNA (cytidine(34)-2'-O)-methyltransferase [Candidatus Methylacidiphilales bacterium]